MKLLNFISEGLPTHRADVNVLFGKELPRCGVFSDVVTHRATECLSEDWPAGAQHLMAYLRFSLIINFLKPLFFLYKSLVLASDDYDIFQVRDLRVAALLVLLVSKIKKKKFCYWLSFPVVELRFKKFKDKPYTFSGLWNLFRGALGYVLLYKIVLPHANHVFVQTDFMLNMVSKKGVDVNKITPVPMCVDADFSRKIFEEYLPDCGVNEAQTLVYLGAMEPERNIEILFPVLKSLLDRGRNVHLLLVGSAESKPHMEWLKKMAEEEGVAEYVIWAGWLPVADAWQLVRAATVGLSPIPRGLLLDCGSPTKAIEYMALGLPVVGNDNPDQKSVIESGGGGFCVPLQADLMVNALEVLLDDNELRAQMARSGREYVMANRRYDVMANIVATVYKDLVSA